MKKGLYRLEIDSENFMHYKYAKLGDNKRYPVIKDMLRDHSGRFWIASSSGLKYLDSCNKEFRNFKLREKKYSDSLEYALNTLLGGRQPAAFVDG